MLVNLSEKAQGRIIWQYRNGKKFRAWIDILPNIGSRDLSKPFEQIAGLINIETAVGEQLDICGRIAGIERPRVLSDELSVFGYAGTTGAANYGVAPYRNPTGELPSMPLPDYLFRLVIRAKIFKNVGNATIDTLKEAADYVLQTNTTVIDGQDMTIQTLWVEDEISDTVRILINKYDLLPRPQGVKLVRVEQTFPAFGYAGSFNARNYDTAPYTAVRDF